MSTPSKPSVTVMAAEPRHPQDTPLAERVAEALIRSPVTDHESLLAVLRSVGCTWSAYVELTAGTDFSMALARMQAARDLPHMAAARSEVIERAKKGDPYALRTVIDTTAKDDLTSDEREYTQRMLRADDKTRLSEIDGHLNKLLALRQTITGRKFRLIDDTPELPDGTS